MQAIQNGRFREDLYYRLNTVPITIPPLRERKTDINLLFRKFATDFAERYHMPVITLTPEAQETLKNYYWPGNIRQLKNVTEQLSVIEKERLIDVDILVSYLPHHVASALPVLYENKTKETVISSEREILFKILFDLQNDINSLKQIVQNLSQTHAPLNNPINIDPLVNMQHSFPENITDMEEIREENLSLEEQERNLIRKALEKNDNNRKLTAQELGISARTLYRKLKEYDII
jgi:transcriptional regulator with PAS, ATPase and Fis domain